jgi:general secretion pathway protein F
MTGRFLFQARGPAGRVERGEIEAPSQSEALARLRRRNLTPFELKPALAQQARAATLNDLAARDLSRTLAQLLRAGLSFPQALKFASEELTAQAANAAGRMREAAERGEPPSQALQELSGPQAKLLTGVVRAGETSGKLAEALEVAASAFARAADMRGRIASALVYPAFVILATLATLAAFIFFVVPTLAEAFTGAEDRLPGSTRALLDLSAWLRANGALAALTGFAVTALAAVNRGARATLGAAVDRLLVSPLGLGVSPRLEFGAFAALAALSLRAGVPAGAAFEAATEAVRNSRIRQRLRRAIADIRLGERPSHAFERYAEPPKSFLRLTLVGEETGKLADAL